MQDEKDRSTLQKPKRSRKSTTTFAAATAWEDNPELIKRFMTNLPAYQQLGSEVAYTLSKVVEREGIAVAAITHRAKDLSSFLEKIERKGFSDPFSQMSDFAGARIVCYYADDMSRIDRLISDTFKAFNRDDKSASAGVDRFGYGGIHYQVKLSDSIAGARYDDLKDLSCEIQLRTVMQDAWAILSHHLLYKREEDTPESMRRSINALAGALDTADLAFKTIRRDRESYLAEVNESIDSSGLQDVEINVDSLKEFLSKRFPDRPYLKNSGRDFTTWMAEKLRDNGIKTLHDFDGLLARTAPAREHFDSLKGAGKTAQIEGVRAIYLAFPELRRKALAHQQDYLQLYETAMEVTTDKSK